MTRLIHLTDNRADKYPDAYTYYTIPQHEITEGMISQGWELVLDPPKRINNVAIEFAYRSLGENYYHINAYLMNGPFTSAKRQELILTGTIWARDLNALEEIMHDHLWRYENNSSRN